VRDLLNAIGMNTDLIALQARDSDLRGIADAARRVRSSTRSLEMLITDKAGTAVAGEAIAYSRALDFLSRRLRIAPVSEDRSPAGTVHADVLEAAARMLTDWLNRRTVDDRARIRIADGCVELELSGLLADPGCEPFCPWYRNDAASPELASLSPAESLRGRGAGFGSWQAPDSAGICVSLI
jgi:hypothetical protein